MPFWPSRPVTPPSSATSPPLPLCKISCTRPYWLLRYRFFNRHFRSKPTRSIGVERGSWKTLKIHISGPIPPRRSIKAALDSSRWNLSFNIKFQRIGPFIPVLKGKNVSTQRSFGTLAARLETYGPLKEGSQHHNIEALSYCPTALGVISSLHETALFVPVELLE